MLLAFNIILDDIIFPDGRTAMNVLGGGGPQAAFGLRLFAEQVGLVATVGDDLPDSVWAWLTESGIDSTGVRVQSGRPTPRAWQVTEGDGRRTQVWRVRPSVAASLPEPIPPATGYHLGLHPDSPNLNFLKELRRNGLVSVETFRAAIQRLDHDSLFKLLTAADIFSTNLTEAQSLVGAGSVRGVARRLVEAAESRAQLIVVRHGAGGALVVEGQTGQAVQVPAWPTTVVDAVGAGNAFCGGFLAGWVESHDIARAGVCGSAAASLVVEQIGVPAATESVRAEAQRRAEVLLTQVERTSL